MLIVESDEFLIKNNLHKRRYYYIATLHLYYKNKEDNNYNRMLILSEQTSVE